MGGVSVEARSGSANEAPSAEQSEAPSADKALSADNVIKYSHATLSVKRAIAKPNAESFMPRPIAKSVT